MLQNLSGPTADLIQVPTALFTASLVNHKYGYVCSFKILKTQIKTRKWMHKMSNTVLQKQNGLIPYIPQEFEVETYLH